MSRAQDAGSSPVEADAGTVAPQARSPDAPTREEPSGEKVVAVRVEGNRRVESEAVRRAMVTREGDLFDERKSPQDLRALWALGYFSDVQLLAQRLPEGVAYVVRVTERPAVREVRLSGNEEISKDDLKEAIELKTSSILDQDVIRRSQKKVQEKYVEKGYFFAEVSHRIDPVGDSNEVDVVFVVRENSKVSVKEIRFIGNERVPASDLREVMQTKEGGLLSFFSGEGTYREEIFQRDLAVIQGIYYDRGFLNLKVDKPIVSISPDKKFIFITLRVDEGEQFSIGKLEFAGDLLKPAEDLERMMTSSEGELFSRSKIGADINRLTDLYYDEGYAYANVTPVSAVNADTRTIDLTFDVQKGRQVTVERIELIGNAKTRDKVIRRELRIYEGELFNGAGMRRSRQRVTALGFFETVEVSHRPGSDDTHVVVQVEVKEKATGTFQVGLGFQRRKLRLHRPGVAAELPRLGPERFGQRPALLPALPGAAVGLRSALPRLGVHRFGGLLPAAGGLPRLRPRLDGWKSQPRLLHPADRRPHRQPDLHARSRERGAGPRLRD